MLKTPRGMVSHIALWRTSFTSTQRRFHGIYSAICDTSIFQITILLACPFVDVAGGIERFENAFQTNKANTQYIIHRESYPAPRCSSKIYMQEGYKGEIAISPVTLTEEERHQCELLVQSFSMLVSMDRVTDLQQLVARNVAQPPLTLQRLMSYKLLR